MDKKRQIQFNLNNFLLSLSSAFDEVKKRKENTSKNHSKRVAYICVRFAVEYNYKQDALFDMCAYALLNSMDCFAKEEKQKLQKILPFKQIHPMFEQFLTLANIVDTRFDLSKNNIENKEEIISFLKQNENNLFSEDLVECFEEFAKTQSFWLDLENENKLLTYIFTTLHDNTIVLDFEQLLEITSILTLLTNDDLSIIENASKVVKYYNFEHKDEQTFKIAASLCNIGKLYIDEKILNKKEKLTTKEYEKIKAYPYYTKKILSNIIGFNDICSYAYKVQEQPDAKGYPFSLEAKDLSLKDRTLALVNIYTALTSNKPYRKAYTNSEALNILNQMAKENRVDETIVKDFEEIFK